jgi:hypothetical protein
MLRRPYRNHVGVAAFFAVVIVGVGVQQTYMILRDRHELLAVHGALEDDRHQNYKVFSSRTSHWRQNASRLQSNLMILQSLSRCANAYQEEQPGEVLLRKDAENYHVSVWENAKFNYLLRSMPLKELSDWTRLYALLESESGAEADARGAIGDANLSYASQDISRICTNAQVTREIQLTEIALTKQLIDGRFLKVISESFNDFPRSLSAEELSQFHHAAAAQTMREIAGPILGD